MDIDPLERALTYPYDAPAVSYLFAAGRAQTFRPPGEMGERRVPVIGYGSNRAPAQLARKYPGAAEAIPMEAAWLEGFDTVYAARISGYGAIPATITPASGCRAPVMITWLSHAQLPAMHKSEGIGVAYDFGMLEAELIGEHSGRLGNAYVYICRAGAFAPEGSPIGLAEIASEGRTWQALRQPEAQAAVARHVEPGSRHPAFTLAHIGDKQLRAARSRRMAEVALPWQHSGFRPLSPEDKL